MLFAKDLAVLFSNSQGEPHLPMVKLYQKISGSFGSVKDANCLAKARS
jgi:hypothetical protein